MPDLAALLRSVDQRDFEAFAAYLTEDVRFRYGSQPAVRGRDAVRAAAAAAVQPFAAVRHRLEKHWVDGDDVVVAGEVAYELADGRIVALEFLNRLQLAGDRIRDYRIYIDPTPVIAALGPAAAEGR